MVYCATSTPQKIANIEGDGQRKLIIRVLNAATLRVSNRAAIGANDTMYGYEQGIPISPSDGIQQLQWKGEIWVCGLDAVFNLEIV